MEVADGLVDVKKVNLYMCPGWVFRPLRILIRVICIPPDPEMAQYGTIGWKKDWGLTDSHILWVSPV